MKTEIKLFGIIALAVIIGFSMTSCGGGDNGDDPDLTGTVSITGTAKVGETLIANIASLDGTGTVTYQWKRDATVIGTNSNTYTVTEADIGLIITVTVTRAGYFGSKTSNPTTAVTADDIPELTGTVSITGTAKVEETLIANIASLGGTGTVSYQWKAGTSNIGTDSNTYVVVEADIGLTITVTVTREGHTGSKTSNPTIAVVAADIPELTGTVSITGTAIVGQTLTANIYDLSGTGTVSYQWKAGTSSIGTDSDTYIVAETDIGLTITVIVTREGYTGSKTSDPTATVIRPYWTVVANSTFGTDIIQSVAWGHGENKKFVAVGRSGKMAYSVDGKTWVAVANSTFDSNSFIMDVATNNGKWVAVGTMGRMAYSTDGITWAPVTTSTFDAGITCIATNINIWVAAGVDGRMAYSSDGETWTRVEDSTFSGEWINSIATGPLSSRFVAVGTRGKIAYSSYGESWFKVTDSTFGTSDINSVARGSKGYVAVGDSGKIAYSTDNGVTWTAVADSPFGSTAIRSVAWRGVNDTFVAVGNYGETAYSTDNGVTWTAVTDGSFGFDSIYGIASNGDIPNTIWVAVGSSGKIAYTGGE
jgi:hypothetical protein